MFTSFGIKTYIAHGFYMTVNAYWTTITYFAVYHLNFMRTLHFLSLSDIISGATMLRFIETHELILFGNTEEVKLLEDTEESS
jgi:hypothetical protein